VEESVVVKRRGPSLAALLRWSGLALAAGGLVLAVATVLHPSRETPATILQAEVRLVAAHALSTLSYLLVLLGLPALYGAASVGMGRLGLVGSCWRSWVRCWSRFPATSGSWPRVLAAESPETIDAINRYPPEAALNGVAFAGFVVGFVGFGVAMARTASFPRPCGVLVAVGTLTQVVGFALAQLVSPAWWIVAILGSLALGAGLAWPGYRIWQRPAL